MYLLLSYYKLGIILFEQMVKSFSISFILFGFTILLLSE